MPDIRQIDDDVFMEWGDSTVWKCSASDAKSLTQALNTHFAQLNAPEMARLKAEKRGGFLPPCDVED